MITLFQCVLICQPYEELLIKCKIRAKSGIVKGAAIFIKVMELSFLFRGIAPIFFLWYFVGMSTARKNVLFLVADDMRVQLGSYEGKYFSSSVHPPMYTPNLDKLSSKSLLLKRAYVQQALCSPSRTSLLTGRRPDTTHVYDLFHYWRHVGGNFTTIPQYFKNHGYLTIGMGKIFHHGMASGSDDPISWSSPYFHGNDSIFDTHFGESWKAVPDDQLKNNPLIDEQIANHAITVLDHVARRYHNEGHPFFLAVGFHKPHLPFVFPASMLQHYPMSNISLPNNPYAPVNMPPVAWGDNHELRLYQDMYALNVTGAINSTLPDSTVLDLRRAYYSAMSWTDSLIGRVVDKLEKLGIADNTIISFFGDHGWQLGEHGEWGKETNFEIATHAPMMVRIPGLTDSGITTEQLTEFVDLFPTLVEAAGLPQLPLCPEDSSKVELCREGSSFIPLMRNPNLAWKNASFSQHPRWLYRSMGYTMKTDDYRYTEWVKFTNKKPDWSTVYGVELYNHTADPDENYNVAEEASFANLRKGLSRQLRAGWRSTIPSDVVHTGPGIVG